MALKPKGQDQVLRNLNRAILDISGRTKAGIDDALFFIREKAISKTPWDTGNLANSFYMRDLLFKGKSPAGEIGNTAEYALPVHENLESNHPVGESKFLENAITENKNKILNIISLRMRV